MAVYNKLNRKGLQKLCMGDINWKAAAGSNMKVQLIEDSYTASTSDFENTADFVNDVSTYDPTSSTPQALTEVDPNIASAGKVYLKTSSAQTSVTFTSVGGTESIGGIYVFKSSGAASTSPLLGLNDFSTGNITANGSDIQVTFNANGLIRFSF